MQIPVFNPPVSLLADAIDCSVQKTFGPKTSSPRYSDSTAMNFTFIIQRGASRGGIVKSACGRSAEVEHISEVHVASDASTESEEVSELEVEVANGVSADTEQVSEVEVASDVSAETQQVCEVEVASGAEQVSEAARGGSALPNGQFIAI